MKRIAPLATDRARRMRHQPTKAECLFWQQLRPLKQRGFHFTRQLPLGAYILDFACRSARFAVELDGGQHAEQASYDRLRTGWLEANGWRVLRIWNADVLVDPARAAEAIFAALCGEATLADVQALHPAVDEPGPTVDPTLSLP